MHHALHIEEILLNIFNYCHTFEYRSWPRGIFPMQRCYANVHLATLARTCRAFKEPALDMIWAELDDLTPLVRCLPRGSSEDELTKPGVRRLGYFMLSWMLLRCSAGSCSLFSQETFREERLGHPSTLCTSCAGTPALVRFFRFGHRLYRSTLQAASFYSIHFSKPPYRRPTRTQRDGYTLDTTPHES